MNAAPAITPLDARSLEALARSPMAAEAAARHEAERSHKRRSILEAMQRDEAAARAEADSKGAQAIAQRAAAEKARATWLQEAGKLQALEWEASRASERADHARGRADAALANLGNAAIVPTIHRLRVAQTESRNAIGYRVERDRYGRTTGAPEKDPTHRLRAARMGELAAAIEALRFDLTASPATIEARCREAIAELEGSAPGKPRERGPYVIAPLGV